MSTRPSPGDVVILQCAQGMRMSDGVVTTGPTGARGVVSFDSLFANQLAELRACVGDAVNEFIPVEWIHPCRLENGWYLAARFTVVNRCAA